jgi:pimeloyl-ACP methyl ester carboxylesterase
VPLNYHRAGTGEPLVLIHGIGSRWQMWEPVLERVAERREVIALDLPGFGASPMPPVGTAAGLDSLSRLVAEFIAEIGLERPHVAGNSLGGWIALELAKQGLARSATALSPAGFHTRPESVFQRSSLWLMVRSARLLAGRADRLVASPRRRKIMFGQVVARPELIPSRDAAESVRALAGAPWFDATLAALITDRFKGGERIDVPVTIAWGERDRLLIFSRQAPRARRLLPRARHVVLHGCGHVPTWDDPDTIVRELLSA